ETKGHEPRTRSPAATVASVQALSPGPRAGGSETAEREPEDGVPLAGDLSTQVSRCFDQQELLGSLHAVYPVPRIRGKRISRLEEKPLGLFMLDAAQAMFLGVENLGVFVGECGGLHKVINHLKELDAANDGGTWVAVPSSKNMAEIIWSN